MYRDLQLSTTPTVRPLDEWDPISAELLGTQTRMVDGRRWTHRVIECGTGGEPLLLIHGTGGQAEAYSRNWHNLARAGFHVFAIDALYHGYSSKSPRVGFEDRAALQADAVADLVTALALPYVNIEGESMGADIAYEFGLRYPGMTGKLVFNTGFPALTSGQGGGKPTGGPGAGGMSDLIRLSHAVIMEPSFPLMRRRLEWLVSRPERMTDEMVKLRLRLYADPDVNEAMRYVVRVGEKPSPPLLRDPEEIADLKVPALVLWTDHNPGQDLEYGRWATSLLSDGTFYAVMDAGHWPQWEKPEEHDQAVIDFVLGPR